MGWGGVGTALRPLAAVRDSILFCGGVSRAVIGPLSESTPPPPPQAMGSTREAEGSRGPCRAMK